MCCAWRNLTSCTPVIWSVIEAYTCLNNNIVCHSVYTYVICCFWIWCISYYCWLLYISTGLSVVFFFQWVCPYILLCSLSGHIWLTCAQCWSLSFITYKNIHTYNKIHLCVYVCACTHVFLKCLKNSSHISPVKTIYTEYIINFDYTPINEEF